MYFFKRYCGRAVLLPLHCLPDLPVELHLHLPGQDPAPPLLVRQGSQPASTVEKLILGKQDELFEAVYVLSPWRQMICTLMWQCHEIIWPFYSMNPTHMGPRKTG